MSRVPNSKNRSRDAPAPELCQPRRRFASGSRMIPKSGVRFSDQIMPKKEGSGAPRGACRPLSAPHIQTSPPECASQTSLRSLRKPICCAEARQKSGRARLPALHAGRPRAVEIGDQRLAGLRVQRRVLPLEAVLPIWALQAALGALFLVSYWRAGKSVMGKRGGEDKGIAIRRFR